MRTIDNTADTTVYVALELSRAIWLVAVRLPGVEKLVFHRLKAGDTGALLAFVAAHRTRTEASLGAPITVASCFEAGPDGFWLHRLLDANGIDNVIVEPTSILISRRSRRAKTDRLDAQGLLRVLMTRHRGDHHICSVLRVPTPEEEDAKRPHRERERLVQERVRIENRIEALLLTQGIRKRPSLRRWDAEMDALRTADGRAMPPLLRAEIDRLKRRLTLTQELIREIEAERSTMLAKAPSDDTSRKVAALSRVRGVGDNFAAVLTREVFYRHFDNRRQLASYVGIAPTPHQSGAMDQDRGIGRAGNARARTTLIQLAWLWLRYQPESGLVAWFRERVGALAGRSRRIAIVAVARKLLVALWRYVETGVLPEGVELKA
ncbi:IS110 family transposase [Paracoccus gahaiensis]|uniref:IS110 family transposase n=1 Tax=Paracoccus gahaiensis TaxID=1706839 RepID=A0A4U0R8A8_9RHOB|nr:IS110 family transposase [Paracoccus gahaiensis]TJZ90660.1 IS110 family transposase [Paracoccus gahaiensis]